MKLIPILLFLFISTLSLAQNWAPIGAKWHVGIIENFFFPDQGYIIIESVGDTVMSGNDCKILSQTRYYLNGNTAILNSLYMYEDSGKVYNYLINDFYTLYDFNAQPGDTWTVVMPYPSLYMQDSLVKVVVDSVTTTFISGQNLKALYVHSDSNYWDFINPIIEKIGSMSGLFPFNYFMIDGDIPFLRCYEDSTIYFQVNPSITCDSLITSVNNNSDINKTVKIWPVPFTDLLNIENLAGDKLDFKIINLMGELVLSDFIERNSLKKLTLKINPGIYFIHFSDKNKTRSFNRKIINQ